MGFFGRKDKEAEAEKKKIGETIQNLSDQVGDLKRKANETEKEHETRVAAMQKQIDEARKQGEVTANKKLDEMQARLDAMAKEKAAMAKEQADAADKKILDAIAANKPAAAAPPAPAATAPAATAPAGALLGQVATGGMEAGATAYVKREGGKNLRRRSGPGLSTEVLGAYEPGTALTLVSGPTENDGHSWWHVRSVDGTEGFVAGGELSLNPQ